MANIVASILEPFAQKDGRSTVHETHTDLLGVKRDIVYLAGAGANLNTAMAQHAVDMGLNLGLAEISDNISQITSLGSLASPSLKYSLLVDNAAAVRQAYRGATKTEAVMIGDYLNTLSSAQLQAAFGLTAGQVTTLKTNKLTPAATLATSIRAAAGQ